MSDFISLDVRARKIKKAYEVVCTQGPNYLSYLFIIDNIETFEKVNETQDPIGVLQIAFQANETAHATSPGYFYDYTEGYCSDDWEEDYAQLEYEEASTQSNNYYALKQFAVKKAAQLLIKDPQGFSFGWGDDANGSKVTYFQRNGYQISFHGCHSEEMPKFPGTWIGERNTIFPEF